MKYVLQHQIFNVYLNMKQILGLRELLLFYAKLFLLKELYNTLAWSHLRNLDAFNDISFRYNAANLRVYQDRQVANKRFEKYFHWGNDRLVSETRVETTNQWVPSENPVGEFTHDLHVKTTTSTLDYLYGVDGIIGFVKDRKDKFYFAKNIQGDVTKIINAKGEIVAEYEYDAWGNHKIIASVDGIADLNPIRYRGYYFDVDTGLYHLKTRYYDPEVGRFINMDSLAVLDITKNYINGLNLYAYCLNNPISYVDHTGMLFTRRFWRGVGNVIAAAFNFVTTVIIETVRLCVALIGSASNFLFGTNFYGFSDWRIDGWGNIRDSWRDLRGSFRGDYQTYVWRDVRDGFWSAVRWIFVDSGVLTFASAIPGIGKIIAYIDLIIEILRGRRNSGSQYMRFALT